MQFALFYSCALRSLILWLEITRCTGNKIDFWFSGVVLANHGVVLAEAFVIHRDGTAMYLSIGSLNPLQNHAKETLAPGYVMERGGELAEGDTS